MTHEVEIGNGPPWGFRISGGAQIYKAIIVSRITPGSAASISGLKVGDIIERVNGISVKSYPRMQVEGMIENSTSPLKLQVISTDGPVAHGSPTAADPAWVAMAKRMNEPRRIGESGPDCGLVTHGHSFAEDRHPVHVDNSTPSIFEARRNPQAMPPNAVLPNPGPSSLSNMIICHECKKPVGKDYTTVSGLNFHPYCFRCAAPNCQGHLDRGYIVEGDRPYCADCHDKYFAKPCARCGRGIVGNSIRGGDQLHTLYWHKSRPLQVFHAMGHQWHLDCFKCSRCAQPFLDGVFYLEEGRLYCENDHKQLFSANCDSCGVGIVAGDKIVRIGSLKWHARCFTCQRCGTNLQGKKFSRKNGLPMCSSCSTEAL